jgi:hypothetical protein
MAVRAPIPPIRGTGIRKPKSARLGMVWITFTKPMIGFRRASRRVRRIPVGIPMNTAIPTEVPTRKRCSTVLASTSARLAIR